MNQEPLKENFILLGPAAAGVLVRSSLALQKAKADLQAAQDAFDSLVLSNVETAGREIGDTGWRLQKGSGEGTPPVWYLERLPAEPPPEKASE